MQTSPEAFSENKKDEVNLKNDSMQTTLETFAENIKKDQIDLKNDSMQTSHEAMAEDNKISNRNSIRKVNLKNNWNNLNNENNLSNNETKIDDQEIKKSLNGIEKIDSKIKKISLELSADNDLSLNSTRKMSENKEMIKIVLNETKKESRISLLDTGIKIENKNQEEKFQNENNNDKEENYKKISNPKNSQSLKENLILNQNEKLFETETFFSNESKNKNRIELEKNKYPEDQNVEIAKTSINYSKEFLTKENVMNLLNLDDYQDRKHNTQEIRNSLKFDSKKNEENTQKTKLSLIKQIKLSLNRKNSEKKSTQKIWKKSLEEKNEENNKIKKFDPQDNLDQMLNETGQKNAVENLFESDKKKKAIEFDKESEINEQKTSINSDEKRNFSKSLVNEQIFKEKLKNSEEKSNKNKESLTNFELNFNSNPNTTESDILVSCQVFYSDKKSKEIDDLKLKKTLSFDQNQDFLFTPEPVEAIEKVINRNRLIYQVAELNSIDLEILNEQALDTFTELTRENLGKYLTKDESTTQLQGRIVQVNNTSPSKDEATFNFQNDFLDESYDIENQIDQELELIKSNRSSFENVKVEQQENNTKVQSVSSFISENEIILTEIEKKSQIFHSKNYYHLIDKGDLDQSDDQSNFRSSEMVDLMNKSRTIFYNRDSLRLSYSSLSMSKNFEKKSATSIVSEKTTITKNKSLSVDTLFKRPSKFSNNSVYDSIHFYCLLKYRIKHLLKIK